MSNIPLSSYAFGQPIQLLEITEIPTSSTVGMIGYIYLCTKNGVLYQYMKDSAGNGAWSELIPSGTVSPSTGVVWNSISASQTLADGNGYILTNTSAPISLTLPSSPVIGTTIYVISGLASQGATISAASGQNILPPTTESTDVTGYSSVTIAPNNRAPVKFVFDSTQNLWVQSDTGITTTGDIVHTPWGSIDFTGETGAAAFFLGNPGSIDPQALFPSAATVGKAIGVISPTSFGLIDVQPYTWQVISASTTSQPNQNFFVQATGLPITITLPPTSSLTDGQTVAVIGVTNPSLVLGTDIVLQANTGQYIQLWGGISNVGGTATSVVPNASLALIWVSSLNTWVQAAGSGLWNVGTYAATPLGSPVAAAVTTPYLFYGSQTSVSTVPVPGTGDNVLRSNAGSAPYWDSVASLSPSIVSISASATISPNTTVQVTGTGVTLTFPPQANWTTGDFIDITVSVGCAPVQLAISGNQSFASAAGTSTPVSSGTVVKATLTSTTTYRIRLGFAVGTQVVGSFYISGGNVTLS